MRCVRMTPLFEERFGDSQEIAFLNNESSLCYKEEQILPIPNFRLNPE